MRLLKEITILAMGIMFGFIITKSWESWNYEEPEPVIITEYQVIEAEPEIITETVYVPYEQPFYRNLTKEDENALLDIAMRESENQGVIGQCWVMYTVICRAEAYGKSIKQVCDSSAFDSSKCRAGMKPNDDSLQALELIREGWTPKPLWFRRDHYHDFGTPLATVGDHCFSGK